jgi:sulfate transport system permease protein
MSSLALDLPNRPRAQRRVLPGFGLSLGFTLTYLSVIVLLPLGAVVFSALHVDPARFWELASDPRALSAYRITFGLSLLAAAVNWVMGVLIAWVLVRYRFPGRALVDAAIDLPFALPTAVAGIALATLYAPNGWLGAPLAAIGIKIGYAPAGIWLALVFVGLPFVVRTVQPVLQDLGPEREEAAATLGANRLLTFWRVVLPAILPASVTGFALAFARAVGEYGSVIFIAGNLPMVSEIVPLLIVVRLEQYDYAGAAVLAVVMLTISLAMLLLINLLQRWSEGRRAHG